jgi:hypothetical protein
MTGPFFPDRMESPGNSRWLARLSIAPGVPHVVRPASHPPCGVGRAVGVAVNTDDGQAVRPSSPSVVVATLTVFLRKAVFRATLPGPIPRTLLFRLRRGSRLIMPSEIRP